MKPKPIGNEFKHAVRHRQIGGGNKRLGAEAERAAREKRSGKLRAARRKEKRHSA